MKKKSDKERERDEAEAFVVWTLFFIIFSYAWFSGSLMIMGLDIVVFGSVLYCSFIRSKYKKKIEHKREEIRQASKNFVK